MSNERLKKLIVTSKPIRFVQLGYDEIYGQNLHLKSIKHGKKYTISGDVFSALEYRMCDNEAACYRDKIYNQIVDDKAKKLLSKWGGKQYSEYHLKREIHNQVTKIFRTFRFAKKVSDKYSFRGKVYLCPEVFSYKLYKILDSHKVFSKDLHISGYSKIYLFIFERMKTLYFLFNLLIFPEMVLLKTIGSKGDKQTKYLACVYMDDGLMGFQMPPNKLFVDNENIKNKDVIFVHEELRQQHWEKILKQDGYNVLNMRDVVKSVSLYEYLTTNYFSMSVFRFKLFVESIKNPIFAISFYKTLRLRLLWELFYKNNKVKNVFRMMISGDLTSTIVQRKNSSITNFVYFSSTEDVVKKRVCSEKSSCIDYTNMIFDNLISSRLSNKWLSTQENSIKNYIPLGPIFSDLVVETRILKKDELRKSIGMKKNDIIISFLDHTTGYAGVLNDSAYKKYLEAMLFLTDEISNARIVFKCKKPIEVIKNTSSHEISNLISKIQLSTSICIANDYGLSSFEVAGLADLVISAPLSSVNYEALCGRIKTLIYDPNSQYGDHNILLNKIPNYTARSYTDLLRLVKYWLFECDDSMFEKFINEYVADELDGCCDGQAVNRFRSRIYEQKV